MFKANSFERALVFPLSQRIRDLLKESRNTDELDDHPPCSWIMLREGCPDRPAGRYQDDLFSGRWGICHG